MTQQYSIDTLLAQAGNRSDERTGAVSTPIYLSTAYGHHGIGESTGFDYTRTKNPTRSVLEDTVAKLEMVIVVLLLLLVWRQFKC